MSLECKPQAGPAQEQLEGERMGTHVKWGINDFCLFKSENVPFFPFFFLDSSYVVVCSAFNPLDLEPSLGAGYRFLRSATLWVSVDTRWWFMGAAKSGNGNDTTKGPRRARCLVWGSGWCGLSTVHGWAVAGLWSQPHTSLDGGRTACCRAGRCGRHWEVPRSFCASSPEIPGLQISASTSTSTTT